MTDIDFDNGTILVLGKKRLQKEKLTLPPESLIDLKAWIGDRRTGPVFTSFGRRYYGRRLAWGSIYPIIVKSGKRCGIVVRPHGIRHAAITDILDAREGSVRSAQRFSRHKDLNTLCHYDDNRKDLGGEVAKLIASRLRAA